jgi:hypothetical protein
VVNGGTDVIIYTVNSFILQQSIPNAQMILARVSLFLNA